MAKTSLNNEVFNQLQTSLAKELLTFQDQHSSAEKHPLRIACGETLHRISKLITQVQKLDNPELILDMECHCEQFDLAYFADTSSKKQSSIQTLQAIQGVKTALLAPLNPEQYKRDLINNVGAQNMGKVPEAAPPDGVHIFVKSQTQKLRNASGRITTPPEEGYFRVRREGLQKLLRLHEQNCKKALGIDRKTQSHEHER